MSPLPGRGRETEPSADAARPLVTAPPLEAAEEDPEDELSPVVEHLEAAIGAAEEQGLSAAEFIGLLTYYAHDVAQEAREAAVRAAGPRSEEE